ncbi:MAG: HlyD family efflux transporter periplasmic adaptor subunit [candidate division Zixibacteria bacterium]|nr:HlyD family efflux transporter periplasmic adaptor subunit [candidate division Zixibacteria bacterium]
MDRVLDKKRFTPKLIAKLAVLTFILFILVYAFICTDTRSSFNVQTERLTISTVEYAPFQVYIAITATVLPIKTVYLDAIEGGRVETIFREVGKVEKGDSLLQLTNSRMLLDIMNREAQLFEQRNNLRNTRLNMEQNKLALQEQLAELNYKIKTSERIFKRNEQLYQKNLIPKDELDQSKEKHEYLMKKHELTIKSQQQDSVFRAMQIEMLEESVVRIGANLVIVKKNLDNLLLKAPVSGHLTSLNAEIGELKSSGERLGQIDILDGFKVRAAIDEHYITRVTTGLRGAFELAGETYQLAVTKMYPEVIDGRFEVDLEFVEEAPADIRRGQSVHIRLELGDLTEAILIPRGGFYRKTGGQWVYAIDPSGNFAIKRDIKPGRQNPRMLEILEGLEPGEQVITSSYDNYGDAEKLILND